MSDACRCWDYSAALGDDRNEVRHSERLVMRKCLTCGRRLA